MRKDRTGEEIDDVEDDRHHCDGGWVDRDADPPRPCLVCRPHLAARRHVDLIPTPRRTTDA